MVVIVVSGDPGVADPYTVTARFFVSVLFRAIRGGDSTKRVVSSRGVAVVTAGIVGWTIMSVAGTCSRDVLGIVMFAMAPGVSFTPVCALAYPDNRRRMMAHTAMIRGDPDISLQPWYMFPPIHSYLLS
jgi:hypothetical protein